VERDLDRHAADRGTQRKGKVTDKVVIPQAATESVKSSTSQVQMKQRTKGQSVENNQKVKDITRSNQASQQKSRPAIEIKKSKTSVPKKSNSEHLIKNRRHSEAKKLTDADGINMEQLPSSRRVEPDCMNPLGVTQRDNRAERRMRDELTSRCSGYGSNQNRPLRLVVLVMGAIRIILFAGVHGGTDLRAVLLTIIVLLNSQGDNTDSQVTLISTRVMVRTFDQVGI